MVIGGAHSNNVLSAAQTLTENNIRIIPFLLGPPSQKLGNAKLFSLFVDDNEIHWISRSQWANCEDLVSNYVEKRKARGIKIFVLPEGAHHWLALPGFFKPARRYPSQREGIGGGTFNIEVQHLGKRLRKGF